MPYTDPAKYREYQARYRREHQAERRAYYRANRERFLADAKRRYEENRDRALENARLRRLANLDSYRAKEREYRKSNSAKRTAAARARNQGLEPLDCDSLKYQVVLRGDPCSYCGAGAEHLDHIYPVSAGGANHWTNLTAACAACNLAKGVTPLLDFLRRKN